MLLYLCIQLSSLLILAISWTIALPCITYLFSTLHLIFLLFSKCIFLSLSTSFWYHMLLNGLCFNLLHKSTLVLDSCTFTMTYNICHLHLWYIMRHIPSYELLLTNTLYNLLLLSYPKQCYSVQLIYVMK